MKNRSKDRLTKSVSSFQELGEDLEKSRTQELLEKRALEAKQREAEFDFKTYSYSVLKDGVEQHNTPHLSEAKNLAKSINGKVWWCVEGAAVSEVT